MQAIFKFSGWRVKTKLFYFFLLISKEKNEISSCKQEQKHCCVFLLSFQQNIFWISYEILQRTSWIFLAALLP